MQAILQSFVQGCIVLPASWFHPPLQIGRIKRVILQVLVQKPIRSIFNKPTLLSFPVHNKFIIPYSMNYIPFPGTVSKRELQQFSLIIKGPPARDHFIPGVLHHVAVIE